MRVLVACEYSGRVREAFAARGWDALSCDLLPSETPGPHYQGDVRDVLHDGWDLLIAFPPCTYLSASGMHWTTRGLRDPQQTEDALRFVRLLLDAPVPHIALENPVGCISTRIRPPDCSIHPWQFGHPESKRTCLWLSHLPPLVPTNVLPLPASGRWANQTPGGQNKLGPSPTRAKVRSATYPGIAEAMADQWSAFLLSAPPTWVSASAAGTHGAQLTLTTMPTAPVSDRTTPRSAATPSFWTGEGCGLSSEVCP